MIDLNGEFEYSTTEMVKVLSETVNIQTIENGYFIDAGKSVDFILRDIGGRIVSQQRSNDVYFQNLSKAIYILEIREHNEVLESFKLLF